MTGMDSDHYQILRDCLNDERDVDQSTFSSLAILTERLEQLKRLDRIFDSVEFAPAVKKLLRCKTAVTV